MMVDGLIWLRHEDIMAREGFCISSHQSPHKWPEIWSSYVCFFVQCDGDLRRNDVTSSYSLNGWYITGTETNGEKLGNVCQLFAWSYQMIKSIHANICLQEYFAINHLIMPRPCNGNQTQCCQFWTENDIPHSLSLTPNQSKIPIMHVNSFRPGDAQMYQWTVSLLVQVNKPLPEPMLTCCQLES